MNTPIGYQAILQRLCSTATLTSIKDTERRDAEKDGDLGPEFDLGFISHAQFDMAIDNNVVRLMFMLFLGLPLNYTRRYQNL